MKKILVSRRKGETQIFILNDGEPQSYFIERDNEPPRLVGSIFKARVEKILPGMQAAFVDIGKDKNAFLQFGKKNLCEGDIVLVQIEKDAEHYKAARATLEISLPSQKIILLPNSNAIHISRKIPPAEKARLKSLAKELLPKNFGVIVRTAAENSTADELTAEINERVNFWHELLKVAENKKKPSLIYGEDLLEKILRENISALDVFVTDNLKIFRRVENLIADEKLLHYEGEELFKMFGVDTEIKNLQKKELELNSGGFIVIEKTEALTVIDVNTGGTDDIFKTNIEAAELAMKQIRLRNIGGIIIIDFVNMKDDAHKKNLLEYLETLAQIDSGKVNVVDMTSLGLVEITRQPY
jgi:ribonuclease G